MAGGYDYSTIVRIAGFGRGAQSPCLLLSEDMRAFYTTYKHIRVFVLGVPESWHVAIYDLQRKIWLEVGGWADGSLKQAKAKALEEAAALVGRKLPELKWH